MTDRPAVDFWFEYASTYSYLAAWRISDLAGKAGVAVRWRPFLLGPIFTAQGWDTSPFKIYPNKGEYMWRDIERLAERYGAPLSPLPELKRGNFPQNSVLAARVTLIALNDGFGEEFARRVFRAEFAEGRDIAESRTVADILQAMRHDPIAIIERAQAEENKLALRRQTEEAQKLKVFGAPSFTAGRELFWGNDRLEQALEWAKR